MGIFKNIEDVGSSVNKLLPLIIRNINNLEKVEIDNVRQYPNDPDNTYHCNMIFYVGSESFDRELARSLRPIKPKILDDIKKYIGVTLISNTSTITARK